VRSGEGPIKRLVATMILCAAAGPLAGCSTTQETAARIQLNDARIRASQVATVVTRSDPTVRVGAVSLISGRPRSAFLVVIHNLSAKAITDLPISVGVRRAGGKRLYLNASAGLPYFANHLPGVAARGTLRWVFTTTHKVAAGARAFALVGPPPQPPLTSVHSLPEITARVLGPSRFAHGAQELRLVVHNLSSVTQYQLQVYGYAVGGRGYVAAGGATVFSLSGDSSTTVRLRLVGRPDRALVQVSASATIYD